MEHRLVGAAYVVVVVSTGSSFRGGAVESGLAGWVVFGTLLGSEGSGVFCLVFQCGPCLLVVPLFLLWGWLALVCGGVPPVF